MKEVEVIQTKQDIPKQQQQKNMPENIGRKCEDIPKPGSKGIKQFWSKIWEQRHHRIKAEWLSSIKKEMKCFEEILKSKIRLDSIEQDLHIWRIILCIVLPWRENPVNSP